MRFYRSLVLSASLMAASSGLMAPAVQAQESQKPVAIVSITPLERLLADISYMLRATNFPEVGGIFSLMTNQYTQGIDRTKPLGVAVSLDGQMPVPVIFLPLSNRDQFFGALGSMGIEPDDLGDGLFEIDANGQLLYAKDANGWLYVSQTEDALANVPADPAALLGDLPKKYDLAIKVNVQALPDDLRDMAAEQMRMGFERTLAEQGDQTEEEQELAREMGEAQLAQIEQLTSETEQVIFGWAIDSKEQKTYMDGAAQFLAGSKLAEQCDAMQSLTSDYTAFKLPNSSAYFRATSEILEQNDKDVMKQNLSNSMKQIEKQIDDGNVGEDSKEMVMGLVGKLQELLEKTIDEGTFDGAGSVSVADNSLRALVGGRIADGRMLEQELKDLVAGLPSGPSTPKAEFDYETYKGVTLHRLTVPVKIPDPSARKVFGNELKISIGTADKSFMLALDAAGDASLKAAIDGMSSASAKAANPFEAVMEMTQILKFAQAVSPNSMLDIATSAIEQAAGKDKLQVLGSVIPRGQIYRLTIEESVLRAAGATASAGAQGAPGF